MSAFLSVQGPDEIAILSDGASYDKGGIVRTIGRKIMTSAKVPLAITTRGAREPGLRLQAALIRKADADGVDAMIKLLADALPSWGCTPDMISQMGLHVHIGAYSETRGLIRLTGHNLPEAFEDGEEPLKLTVASGAYNAGNICTIDEYAAHGVTQRAPGEKPSRYFKRVGAGLMEAMRRKPGLPLPFEPDAKEEYVIGGQCDLTIVRPTGVSTMTLRTWPDEIGKRIDPMAGDARRRSVEGIETVVEHWPWLLSA